MHHAGRNQVDEDPWWEWDSDLNQDLDLNLGGLFAQCDGLLTPGDTSCLSNANAISNLSPNLNTSMDPLAGLPRDSPYSGLVNLESGSPPPHTTLRCHHLSPHWPWRIKAQYVQRIQYRLSLLPLSCQGSQKLVCRAYGAAIPQS